MWTYYWYLMKKEELQGNQYLDEPGDWVLVCPDFPSLVITDELLSADCAMDNWNTHIMIERARYSTELATALMLKRGDTIPTPQKEMPGYFSFKIEISYQEEDLNEDT